jgi:hypothetical protein
VRQRQGRDIEPTQPWQTCATGHVAPDLGTSQCASEEERGDRDERSTDGGEIADRAAAGDRHIAIPEHDEPHERSQRKGAGAGEKRR